jgi:hypothetical protein
MFPHYQWAFSFADGSPVFSPELGAGVIVRSLPSGAAVFRDSSGREWVCSLDMLFRPALNPQDPCGDEGSFLVVGRSSNGVVFPDEGLGL